MKKNKLFWKSSVFILSLEMMVGLALAIQLNLSPHFDIKERSLDPQVVLETTKLPDKDNDGIDDFTEIMLGARADALNNPKYDGSAYYQGGYPPDNIGVCSDVIWRALKPAGYNLKDLLDADIAAHPNLYPNGKNPDPNIDFRRTKNLRIFFERHLQKLTLNVYDIDQWLPGDIVMFYPDYHHTGIISDQYNFLGIPYLIHNTGQKDREEDIMMYANYHATITGHYRWIYRP